MAKSPLGRGLGALLPRDSQAGEEVRLIDIDLIRPSQDQPRAQFDERRLNELAQSIRINGIIQPLLLRRHGGVFELIAGERRWRAAQLAGIRSVPAIVREIPDEKVLELSLIENIQRQELNPLEEARAYRKLIDGLKLSHEEVAQRVGRDRSFITNYLRVLKLPEDVLELVADEKLSIGHARALLAIDSPPLLRSFTQRVLKRHWSVRETEDRIRKLGPKAAHSTKSPFEADPNVRAAEAKLRTHLGRQVRITQDKANPSGRIELHYYDQSDLMRLYDGLMRLANI